MVQTSILRQIPFGALIREFWTRVWLFLPQIIRKNLLFILAMGALLGYAAHTGRIKLPVFSANQKKEVQKRDVRRLGLGSFNDGPVVEKKKIVTTAKELLKLFDSKDQAGLSEVSTIAAKQAVYWAFMKGVRTKDGVVDFWRDGVRPVNWPELKKFSKDH